MPVDSSSSGEENIANSDEGSIDGDADGIARNADLAAVATAQSLVSGNPLKLFERKSNGKLKGAEDPTVVEEYLRSLFALPNCFSKYNNKFTSCCCLNEHQENVAYMILADRLSKCFCFLFINII
jgi:hypothetical protein